MPSVIAVIPARWASQRFPGKVLTDLAGKPMVQWVHERASRAQRVDRVLVATEDERVAECVRGFGGEVVMTSADHPTGTDRVAEAIAGIDADWIVNVQADEPMLPPAVIDALVEDVVAHPEVEMATVGVPMAADDPDLEDRDVVKVVASARGDALYFSRAPIPWARDARPDDAPVLRHWGIYAFRRDYLERFVKLPQSPLERCESLEQLRALEDGARIRVVRSQQRAIGVDRPGDAARVAELLRKERT
jgi:3-deoxy-manno-octulosonate cytidylyltransferase (CMP-KDO synthetase)